MDLQVNATRVLRAVLPSRDRIQLAKPSSTRAEGMKMSVSLDSRAGYWATAVDDERAATPRSPF
jgi:hypothetical protein